jgi:hypothetical protein
MGRVFILLSSWGVVGLLAIVVVLTMRRPLYL